MPHPHDVMARVLRLDIENGLYHVTSRGRRRWTIARDDGAHKKLIFKT